MNQVESRRLKPVILHVGIDLKFLTDLTATAAHLPIEIHLAVCRRVVDSVVLLPSLTPSFETSVS